MHFLPRDAMPTQYYATALCPSVCPLQANIVPKWLNVGSRKKQQRHTIAYGVRFSVAKDRG